MKTWSSSVADLNAAFLRLDSLLARAIALAHTTYGPDAAKDPYRGLHIRPEEVSRLLAQPPGMPVLWSSEDLPPSAGGGAGSRLAALAAAVGLDSFDLDVLIVALAPEFDLRYERIYAFLQDDVTRRRPSVDLALNLLCPAAETKLLRRSHFAADAPLFRRGLLTLASDPQKPRSPLLARDLEPDEQVVSWLLGREGLDPQLAPCCRCITPRAALDQLLMSDERKRALLALAEQADAGPLTLYFHGRAGTGKRSVAEALANARELRLLSTDVPLMVRAGDSFDGLCRRLWREACFQPAAVFIESVDALAADEHDREIQCLRALAEDCPTVLFLAGSDPDWGVRCGLPGVIDVPFSVPDHAQRRGLWQMHLGAAAAAVAGADLDTLAQRFQLTPGQIGNACALARAQARWGAVARPGPATTAEPTFHHLMQAARAQSGHALAKLARKLAPKYRWADIVLPEDQGAQLREICRQFTYRPTVYGEWGFGGKLSSGKGLHVLFSGPSGTGKTMAAEVIANELGLDLYKIDLSQVVSKYIGETEKNLDRIFASAEDANAILFFDEADALFGKRSEVKDAHDRYANIEVGYLLQKMEEHEGIAILATNLKSHLDSAFLRRLQMVVEFPFPDEAHRRRIWAGVFPRETPLGEDVDVDLLAREVRLAGGNITNIGLTAAFYAAENGGAIHMPHVWRAVRREHQKLGVLSANPPEARR